MVPASQTSGTGKSNRRRFLWSIVGSAAALLLYSRLISTRRIEQTTTDVPIRGLPKSFHDLRIVQLCDFHRGPWVDESLIRRAGDMARSADPDLVVITGDMVTGTPSLIWSCLDALGAIPSPLGTYAVLGNHDWRAGAAEIRTAMETAGITVLSNATIQLGHRGEHIWLLGMEDLWSPAHSLSETLSAVDDNAPSILLCHNPDIFSGAVRNGIELVLSGHTHGGQIRIPGFGPLLVPIQEGRWLASGLRRRGGTQIYVNRGIGVVAPPVRLFCRPEVALIRLLSEADPQVI